MTDRSQMTTSLNFYSNPKHDNIYSSFSLYFGNPKLLKTNVSQNNESMYCIKIKCHLIGKYRYLIVLVKNDANPIGYEKSLYDIKWTSLQTRTFTKDPYALNIHNYIPENKYDMNSKITFFSKDETSMTYSCVNFPIKLTLLFTDKQNIYAKSGVISSAIEEFNTIVTIEN